MLTKGKYWTEEVHFVDGSRQTLKGVVLSEQGQWWHKRTQDGRYYILNPDKILFVRVYE